MQLYLSILLDIYALLYANSICTKYNTEPRFCSEISEQVMFVKKDTLSLYELEWILSLKNLGKNKIIKKMYSRSKADQIEF